MNIKSLISLPVAALAVLLCAPVAGSAQSILLSAGNFAVLAQTTVTNIGATVISSGNLGLSPGTSVTGFPPGTLAGGGSIIIGGSSAQAVLDLGTAASGLAGMAPTTVMASTHLGGLTLTPGVYKFTGSADLNGALTLDAQGQNDAYWVFQIGSALTTNTTSSVTIINPGSNGGSDDGVFWDAQTGITINGGQILGNYLAGTAITLSGTVAGNGRALADTAVTLSNNLINSQGGPSGSDYTGGLMYNGSAVVPTPPLFSLQPNSQSVTLGANATFTSLASNGPDYQWQRQANGTLGFSNLTNTGAYSNVTTANLTVTNTTLAMSGDQFQVIATNFSGNPTSSAVLLTVNLPPVPVVTTQPVNAAINVGGSTIFSVAANGNATYQWQVLTIGGGNFANITNGSTYSGVATANLSISDATLAMSGDQFRALATNLGGSTPTDAATLTVNSLLPVITLQPMDTTIRATQNVTFRVVATGPGPLTYVWKRNNIKISNGPRVKLATTATLVLTHMVFGNAGNYTVTVTNPNGSVISDDAKLTIIPWRP